MLGFIVRRLIAMVLTIWAVSFVSFAIIQLPPGDYLTSYMAELSAAGDRIDPATIEALRRQYGLGDPFIIQYFKWIGGVLHGDFGNSFEWSAPVTDLIWGRLGNSVLVEGLAVLVMWLVALPIGIYAAVRKYSLGDYLATIGGFIGLAIPNFLFALVLMYLWYIYFGETLGGLYSPDLQGTPWNLERILDFLAHAWAPVLVLSTAGTAQLIRVMRANLLDELTKPYVTTARSKGLSESRIMYGHVFRNAMILVLSGLPGLFVGLLFTGSVLIERIFNLNGLGLLGLESLSNRDYPVLYANIWIGGLLGLTLHLISDISYTLIDPRISFEARKV